MDISVLIDISAGTRLPQYEQEIFSDKGLTNHYLDRLYDWPAYWWLTSDSAIAYTYANEIMKSRWPEAEAIIATDPCWAYYYAKFVMKSRWPEAESVIATHDMYREWYNDKFGTSL